MDESKVVMKGRLGPGMMISVDLPGGQVCTTIFYLFTLFFFFLFSFALSFFKSDINILLKKILKKSVFHKSSFPDCFLL